MDFGDHAQAPEGGDASHIDQPINDMTGRKTS